MDKWILVPVLLSLLVGCATTRIEKPQAIDLSKVDADVARHYQGAIDGDRDSQNSLAIDYEEGRGGLEVDDKSAFYWFYQSAKQGYVYAISNVGLQYYHGDGVQKDDDKAYHWFRKAAEKGNAGAMALLGEIYATGCLGKTDFEKANYWCSMALLQDDLDAINDAAWILSTMEDINYLNPEFAVYSMERLVLIIPDDNHYDTLAAAYAADNNFPRALAAIDMAIDMAIENQNDAVLDGYYERKEIYEKGKRYVFYHRNGTQQGHGEDF